MPDDAARFTANFKHTVKKEIEGYRYETLETGDYFAFDSICTETMVGFMQYTDTKEWACAYAVQTEHAPGYEQETDREIAFIKH